ncbi:TRADD-N-associated membrane domain-containing protein [Streptomyces canus]|uniref:TRADD-N-associated membrane domain-containing protein n=1 Tax=Streptomyces canus TaxID=58343 RepID=UPI0033BAE681
MSDEATKPQASSVFISQQFKITFLASVVIVCLGMATYVALALFGGRGDAVRSAADTASSIFKIGFGLMIGMLVAATSGTSAPLHDTKREDAALKDLSADDRQFANLLTYNREQILRYHDIVRDQATRSFRAGQRASAAGLLILGVCLWVGLNNKGVEIKWFSGALAAIGTAISTFINRTYMHMYNKSIKQLSEYFDQPVIAGYHLTAERLSKVSALDKGLRNKIIQSVLLAAAQVSSRKVGESEPPINGEEATVSE